MNAPENIKPEGFITDTAVVVTWDAVTDATSYSVTIKNNVTGDTVTNGDVTTETFDAGTLALGTYSLEISATDGTDTSASVTILYVTDTIATYDVVGRDGDKLFYQYKSYQKQLRRKTRELKSVTAAIVNIDLAISALVQPDADLKAYHQNSMKQTPNLTGDLVELKTQLLALAGTLATIQKRDPEF